MERPIQNDASRFDRLVDGELSEQERRELLAGLDSEPGGWRRCALAFLEAQCWKESLPKMMFQSRDHEEIKPAAAVPMAQGATVRSRSHWTHRLQSVMAMAACFLVALLIGSMLPRGHFSPASPSDDSAATQLAAARKEGTKEQLADKGVGRSTTRDDRATTPPLRDDGWQMVTLSPDDQGGSYVKVPAVERSSVDDAWLRSAPPAMPAEVLQALERTGHQVQQHRELMPVQMKDGRRLMVPVDQVDVQYKGNGAF